MVNNLTGWGQFVRGPNNLGFFFLSHALKTNIFAAQTICANVCSHSLLKGLGNGSREIDDIWMANLPFFSTRLSPNQLATLNGSLEPQLDNASSKGQRKQKNQLGGCVI